MDRICDDFLERVGSIMIVFSHGQIQEMLGKYSMYMYGGGQIGENFLKHFTYPDEIKSCVDDYSSKAYIQVMNVIRGKLVTKPVNRLTEVLAREKNKPIWIIITSSQYGPIKRALEKEGITNFSFAWSFRECLENKFFESVVPVEKIVGSDDLIEEVYNLLEDEESKVVYRKVIRNRQTGEMDYSDVMSSSEQYFEPEIMPLSDNECIVDAGSFVGDTVLAYKRICSGWKNIYCFEPDIENFRRLKNNTKNFKNCTCICAGLGECSAQMNFCALGGDGSKVDKFGKDKIKIQSIDELNDKSISFIKMDIEGFEIEALRGARRVILENAPKLAISIYHKPDHLWKIPLMVKSWNPKYKLYIRHYSVMCAETILYAVP